MAKPIVAILCANSKQSRAIVDHIATSESTNAAYTFRAVVRNPSSFVNPSPDRITEVFKGDVESQSSLVDALTGASIVFAMTTPKATLGESYEYQCGKNIVDAFVQTCASNSDAHLIFSSFPDVERLSNGRYKMSNGTSKAKVQAYILSERRRLGFNATFIYPGMFMQNFTTYQPPQIVDGVYHFLAPVRLDVQLPFVDISDMGPLFMDILSQPTEYDGKVVRLYGERLTYPQLVARFTQVTGQDAVYDHLSVSAFLSQMLGCSAEEARKDPMGSMLGSMYDWINEFGYWGEGSDVRDDDGVPHIEQQPTRRTTFRQFVRQHFPTEPATKTLSELKPSSRSAAERALITWFNFFLPHNSHLNFADHVLPMFSKDAVVRFPYVPRHLKSVVPSSMTGHSEILAYFGDWKNTFYFEKGAMEQLAALEGTDGSEAVMRVRLEGVLKPGGHEYIQDYVSFVKLDDAGMIIEYVEHWAADRFST
ncbi:hypothetical protein HDU85_001616 [Gaertneriomyces sp. JEL0708]|nr:hypothetical protein HDU85_001616 [Gaertneriomyces sp. JEL0708]